MSDTNSLGHSRSYRYDAVGNQVGMTDRNGRRLSYSYDGLDRQTSEQWLDGAGQPIYGLSYTYDAASQLTTATDPTARYGYTYDLAGRLTRTDNAGTVGVPNVVFDYEYDAVNNLRFVRDRINGQAAGIEEFTYDALNRTTQITQSGNGVSQKRVDMGYDAASQMTSLSRFGDLAGSQSVAESEFTYDLGGRLTHLSHSHLDTVLAAYGLTYDAANRITRISSVDGINDYTYDQRDQLLGADYDYQGDEVYSYDENGNRTNAGYVTGVNNQLLSDGTYTYTYDNEGNRTSRTNIATGEVTQYGWDYRNRLVEVVTKDSSGTITQQVTYTYDFENRRIAKTVDPDGSGVASATTERFVYDGNHIALVFDGEGNQTYRYLHGPQVDQVLAQEDAQGNTLWSLTDHQGTVRDLVDEAGIPVNHISYDSFGQTTAQTNPTVYFRFGYTGREPDAETGLTYYRGRYFDPRTGGFIGEDPIGFNAGDTNLYRYVRNSPTNLIDPLGLDGKVISQERVIVLSSGDRYIDNGQEQSYIPSLTPLGIQFPSIPLRTPGSSGREPIIGNHRIIEDTTRAKIEYTPIPNGESKRRAIPWGGLYTHPGLDQEHRGHITPKVLGGSDRNRFNFMSQNPSINRGGYNQFGKDINAYLTRLGIQYEKEKAAYDKIIREGKTCPSGPRPKPPTVELVVNLGRYKNEPYNRAFPFRPDVIEAEATFSDGKVIRGWFSNDPNVETKPKASWFWIQK
ncbi:RHS repeat-associated core domain protein [Synechococcus sp. PCC 6312]|nr:RHS repeat-associated core domain protein [Synechococcus sp. PCC 6312]